MDTNRTIVVDAGAVIHGARLHKYGSRAVGRILFFGGILVI